MSDARQFPPRVMTGVILIGVLLFAAMIYVSATSGRGRPANGPYPSSTSAIGYQGIVRLLRELGFALSVVDRLPAPDDLEDALVILPEPSLEAISSNTALALWSAPNLLVILPKWQPVADPRRGDWVARVREDDPARARQVLALVDYGADLLRVGQTGGWHLGPLPAAPALPAPQLVVSDDLIPVVSADQGLLVGRLETEQGRRWVLSDPDLLSNHGLKRQSDPAIPVALIDALLDGGRRIYVLDLHPELLADPRSLTRLLFSFPTIIVTGQVVLATLLLFWAASARFGRPRPPDRGLPTGKQTLVENAAGLLAFAGHQAIVTRRYFEIALAMIAERLHVPRGLDPRQQLDWLRQVAEARGLDLDGATLARRVHAATEGREGRKLGAAQALALARMTDRWRGELLDEPRRHSGNH